MVIITILNLEDKSVALWQKHNTCIAGRCTLADVMASHDLPHKLTQNTYNYVAKMKKHDNTIFLMITLMQLDHYTYLT